MIDVIRPRWFLVLIGLPLALGAVAAAPPSPTRYLNGAALTFTLPTARADAGTTELELTSVRAAQPGPWSARSDEAIADAKAFGAPDLIGRFSEAAQVQLTPATRPMLLRLLTRALAEVSHYSEFYKAVAERKRPYVEDSSVKLCYDNPQHKLDLLRSYPSGHAANGYAAALFLADVMPGRRQALLARGMRYGENRVVCGAHHPSDVLEGQLLAIEYYREVQPSPRLTADLVCARAEDAVINNKLAALPASCTAPGA